MTDRQIAPYGSWKSPITAKMIASGQVGLGQVQLDGEDVYWIESRPREQGRNVIVRRTADGRRSDVTPAPFNVRSRAHEYGGGAYAVEGGTIVFSHFADHRLYRQTPGEAPQPITAEGMFYYADGVFDRRRNRFICVREDHTVARREAVNTLVAVALDGSHKVEVLVSGNDFYAAPRVSPDGSRLAWLTWNHPNLPWDGTELWTAELAADGSLRGARRVAGGPRESIFQPEWSPDGALHFVSDRTDWWNLYRWRDGAVESLCPMEAEFGRPAWAFGLTTYAFESPGRIVCTFCREGTWSLASLDPATKKLAPLEGPWTSIGDVSVSRGRAVFIAGTPTTATAVTQLELASGRSEILRSSTEIAVDEGYLSKAQAVEFPTEGGKTAHAFFYPPQNRDFAGPETERPPLIVISHGGPTGAAANALRWDVQFWTSRGLAVLDVNYGGSSGFGRPYRERLYGQWGVVDVDDCAAGARWLVGRGLVDGNRLAIRGGSAGGYTTLCALTFRNVFKVGASYFGLSELEVFVHDTHKFESRYLDRLIGPYPARRDLYLERSPLKFADRLSCPVIFFQGLDDRIVPPNQAELMVEALRKKKVPVAYLAFEGEQHGFRKAENIERSLTAELYFYSRILGFPIADQIEPVTIENM